MYSLTPVLPALAQGSSKAEQEAPAGTQAHVGHKAPLTDLGQPNTSLFLSSGLHPSLRTHA